MANNPVHIAFIMDGNRRWAKQHHRSLTQGYLAGMQALRDVIQQSLDCGIPYITVWAFSKDNWKRPQQWLDLYKGLLHRYLKTQCLEAAQNGIKVCFVGNKDFMGLRETVDAIEHVSQSNTKMTLTLVLDYSGQQDIKAAVQKTLPGEDFTQNLSTAFLPPVDLLIRTSGEQRLSNFFLWELAYAELLFTETLWPDFDKFAYAQALQDFQNRQRRFGA